jgi:single-strand DNA-binding protein
MIRAAIYGRLGGTPVNRTTRSGNEMVTASLAVDVARTGADQDTEWVSIAAFGAAAEALARHEKGDLMAINGQLHRTHFNGRDGQERSVWSLTADSIVSARTVRPGGRCSAVPRPKTRRTQNAQPALREGPPLLADSVDALWTGAP